MTKIAKNITKKSSKGETDVIPLNAMTHKPYFDAAIVQILKEAAIAKGYISPRWATLKNWNKLKKSIAKDQHGTLVITYDIQEQRVEDGIEEVRVPVDTYLFNECQLKGYRG